MRMQKQQQKVKQKNSEKGERESLRLNKLIKLERTYSVEYEIVKQLIKQISKSEGCDFEVFKSAYCQLSRQIKNTLLFKLLNYQIWNDETLPVDIREKTQFFKIISEWIIVYELKVAQLKTFQSQIAFLYDFFTKETKNIFQKIVLIEEIHEDLLELLGSDFWGTNLRKEDHEATKQQAGQLLKFLAGLVEYYCFFEKEGVALYNCELFLLKQKSENYKQFIYRSIEYILSVNSGKKSADKYLDKPQEMELTRIALVFLQRPEMTPAKSTALLKMLMLRTSKVVRYAMVVDYVRLYQFLEKSKQYEILEELENMVYFRQLIIGQSQISQAGLITNELGKPMEIIQVPARTKQRILITHEQQFGGHSIFQLEFIIEGGDISIAIVSLKQGKEVPYWKQDRTEDRRVDILIKDEGLYVIELDNTYSWLKAKKVSYKMEQFCGGTVP